MSEVQKLAKGAKTIQDEISSTKEKLRKLEDRQKEQVKKERDRNQRAVLDIIKAEKLDVVSPEKWQEAMPKIRAILLSKDSKTEEVVKPVKNVPEPVIPAAAA